jgi:D-3-phosphoglycerate dehydrogenase
MRKRILITESRGFPPAALERLRQVADVVTGELDRSQLERAIGSADILLVRLRHRIDAALLSLAPSLETIATPTTGLTHIDTREVERRGIDLLCLRGETSFLKDVRATAEHTIGLMLALTRHIAAASAHVAAGGWNRDEFRGTELFRKTIAIVGYGRLGRIVARYLKAFDCRVLAVDPYLDPRLLEPGVEAARLEQALPVADIVTLHVNLNDETRQFFGVPQFDAMKHGSYFINTSRGELVDETALLAALRSGHIAGAAVDVVCEEQSSGMGRRPLVQYSRGNSNLLVTPHIGGCTIESMQKTELFLSEKLIEYMAARMHNELTSAAG